MAVYTEVSDEELERFVAAYDIGALLSFRGIAEGVENSNYLLHAEGGQFILTLYEKRVDPKDLPFFLGLMEHLSARGVTCPTPVRDRSGEALRQLAGRPAAVVTFLQGVWPRRPQAPHCLALGGALARMHEAGEGFALRRANALALPGWRPLLEASGRRGDEVLPGLYDELARELDALEARWPAGLPNGLIHADLFPDNVFFLRDDVSGIIDFYFACNDALAYDIAICLNAWCFEPDLAFNVTKARMLLAGYQRVRPLAPEEVAALPILARGSAVRFLLTRLYDWLNTPPSAFVKRKDPMEYVRKLRFHRRVASARDYGLDA